MTVGAIDEVTTTERTLHDRLQPLPQPPTVRLGGRTHVFVVSDAIQHVSCRLAEHEFKEQTCVRMLSWTAPLCNANLSVRVLEYRL